MCVVNNYFLFNVYKALGFVLVFWLSIKSFSIIVTFGVRSGMVAPGQELRMLVRFSARPPSKFTTGADFNLWIRRVDLYFEEADVPVAKRARELLALLDDASYRVVDLLGLMDSGDYGVSATNLSFTKRD